MSSSRSGDDTSIEELVPYVGQSWEAPVDAVGIGGGVRLLLGSQHLALPDGVDRSVSVFAIFRECGDV